MGDSALRRGHCSSKLDFVVLQYAVPFVFLLRSLVSLAGRPVRLALPTGHLTERPSRKNKGAPFLPIRDDASRLDLDHSTATYGRKTH